MKVKLCLLSVLAAALFLSPLGGTALLAQETTDVHGQVVNGTEGAETPDGLTVLMLVTAADGRLAGTGQAAVDSRGRFVFEDVEVEAGGSYTFSVDHLGVFYGLSLDAGGLADDLLITVFETTRDAGIIRVEQHVMVVAALDKGGQSVSFLEFITFVNPTDRTLLPDLTKMDQISFLRFALPPGPAGLDVESDLPGGDIVSIGTGFAVTSPVTPGDHSMNFSYTVPYQDETIAYRQSLVQGADLFQVWIPESIPNLAVPGLENIDSISVEGTSYRVYEGRDFPPGQGLQLELTGLPLPGVWTRFSGSVTGGAFWQIAIPSALGATLAAMLLWGMIRGYRPAAASVGPDTPALAVDPAERAAVVRAVADLDQRRQEGDLPEAEYRTQRRELMARVLDPGFSQDSGGDEGPLGDRPA